MGYFILEVGGCPHAFANPLSPAWVSLPLLPHPHPSSPPPRGCPAPKVLRGVPPCFLLAPILRISVSAAGESSLCPGSVIPVPHHIVLSPAISEGLMTNGSLSSRRLSMGIQSRPPLPVSSALDLKDHVCLGQLGGQAIPLGKATLHPPPGSAQSH